MINTQKQYSKHIFYFCYFYQDRPVSKNWQVDQRILYYSICLVLLYLFKDNEKEIVNYFLWMIYFWREDQLLQNMPFGLAIFPSMFLF